jgi:hypothetical protein
MEFIENYQPRMTKIFGKNLQELARDRNRSFGLGHEKVTMTTTMMVVVV